ncbi:hypothetical protein Tco_1283934 [Tanacetum coccineum]
MRTRSQSRRRRQQQVPQTSVESPNLEKPNNNQEPPNPPIVTMADNRTMAQLLEAPTEGYEDAIVVPEMTADVPALEDSSPLSAHQSLPSNQPIIGAKILAVGSISDLTRIANVAICLRLTCASLLNDLVQKPTTICASSIDDVAPLE